MNNAVSRTARVLVVEDEPHVALLLQFVLEAAGYDVRCAGDGHEAAARIATDQPDAVVLDLSLPKQSGLDVLRGMSAGVARPVVLVLTSRVSAYLREEVIAAGANALCGKPVAPTTLLAELAALGVGPMICVGGPS